MLKKAAAFLLLLALVPGCRLFSQMTPLEDKSKYEKFMEQKANETLMKLFGPNKAKVSVEIDMDLTMTEKMESGDGSQGKNSVYKWYQDQQKNILESSDDSLMPGFPAASPLNPYKNENQAYKKEVSFPVSFIKKISVTLLVDSSLSQVQVKNMEEIVSNVLNINTERGDEVVIIKTAFAPIWENIWYNPETLSMALKYGMITLISIIGIIAATVSFLKLSKSMSYMAKAQQQSYEMSMNMAGGDKPGEGFPDGGLDGPEDRPAVEDKTGDGGLEAEPGGGEKIVITIEDEKVPYLVNMLGKESPENISLVVELLNKEQKSRFLNLLPEIVLPDVLSNLSKVRFIDEDKMMMIKEEVEKRMKGTVGGIKKIMEIIDEFDLKRKKILINSFQGKNEELYKALRSRFIFEEDLAVLTEKDIGLLFSEVKMDDWLNLVWTLNEDFKNKLKSQLTANAWRIIEQSMRYDRPPEPKIEKSMETLLGSVLKLVKEGRIKMPAAVNSEVEYEKKA